MISVLIPVYNTPPLFLRECLESCLDQTIQDYEIVVVNNGTNNPATNSVLSAYNKNKKFKIFDCERQTDKKNLSIALNYGLQHCKYNLVARMDSDDVMIPDRLEKQRNFMLENPAVDVLGGQIHVSPDGYITNHPANVTKEIALGSFWFINHPTVMYRRDKILSIGGYKEYPELFAEDYELWVKCLINNIKIKNLPDTLVNYRSYGGNLTRLTETDPNYYNNMWIEQNKLRG
jgi:glycosyltransferase involved in cell wall biosynthesis